MWEDIKDKCNKIIENIGDYNKKIENGNCLAFSDCLDITIYYDIITAHIINYLMKNKSLYIKNEYVEMLGLKHSVFFSFVEWDIHDDKLYLKNIGISEKELVVYCFNEKCKRFVKEICAQDLVCNRRTAKDIYSLLGSLSTSIELDVNGEEEMINRLLRAREKGESIKQYTKIEDRFRFEYSNNGALIRNRIFKHKNFGKTLSEKVKLSNEHDELLDYRTYGNICQTALLHIGVEETGSCGTGFIINEEGYALTCAHVVGDAKKIYATVINGDGYPIDDMEGFEVYDAGDGEVVYLNRQLDIALLKMEHFGLGFLPIEQGNILPELGEEVVVFGYPLGYEMPQSNFFGPNISFYRGYISSNQIKDGNSVTFLDIDVKSGNSGSPVISAKTGKVIGIMSGIKVGGKWALNEKMPYMIPIQHFNELNK